MPAAIIPTLRAAEGLRRKRFSSAEVVQMLNLGLFAGSRYELIDGDLIDKMGQNPPHATGVEKLMDLLVTLFGLRRVRVQLPIEAGVRDREWSVPEPDLAVLKERLVDYERRHPRGDELVLVAEVADSSVQQDSTVKRDLYARAAIQEYWLLDVNDRVLRVYRQLEDAQYGECVELGEGDTIPGAAMRVSDLLPGISAS